MDPRPDEIHIETDRARGGSTPNVVRWVLAISLLAAIALLSVIWMTGAATQDQADSNVDAAAPLRDGNSANATDSIVDDRVDQTDTAAPSQPIEAPEAAAQ